MSRPRPSLPFDRLAYFDGAELAHIDLRDAVGYEARMLAVHVRAMHDTWGIASGLEVKLAADARSVHVTKGAAYDCRGNVLVLPAKTTVPAPTEAKPDETQPAFDLVLRTAGAGDARSCERMATCNADTKSPRPTKLVWLSSHRSKSGVTHLGDDVRLGDDVPLARFVRHANGTLVGPDFAERHRVRPMTRPYVATGVATGSLEWKRIGAELVATVDTSSAAFGATPSYIAELSKVKSAQGRIGPWLHVDSATPTGFVARLVAVVDGQPAIDTLEPLESDLADVSLTWIGVEPSSACGGDDGEDT